MANQCTKFKITGFSHPGDILGGTKNLNGSHDHNHVPLGWIFICLVKLDICVLNLTAIP